MLVKCPHCQKFNRLPLERLGVRAEVVKSTDDSGYTDLMSVEAVAADGSVHSAQGTLIGKGNNGTDLILLTAPELKVPEANAQINTNVFARLTPNTTATTLQLVDVAAPTEIPTPIADGGITTLYTMRSTSGWGIRPEALTLLSAAY